MQSIVDEVNARFASVEQVKKFRMLPKELDHEDGELTATQKVKRSAIASSSPTRSRSMYRRREGPGARACCAGLGTGSVYALLALGFVIIYKATRVISFAQPAFMLAGAVLVTYLVGPLGLLPGGAARGRCSPALLALGVERVAVRPMVGRPVFAIAIITLGIDIAVRVVVNGVHRPRRAPGRRPVGAVHRGRCPAGSWCEQRHLAMLVDHGRAGRRAVRVLPVHPDGPGDARGRVRPGGRAGAGVSGRRGVRAVLGARRRAGRRRRHVRRRRRRASTSSCGSSR